MHQNSHRPRKSVAQAGDVGSADGRLVDIERQVLTSDLAIADRLWLDGLSAHAAHTVKHTMPSASGDCSIGAVPTVAITGSS